MLGIVGVIAFLMVLALSLIITRLATVALTLTGLSEEAARFQARSAFTGTGFTTKEAEKVVTHPVRRRSIMLLMIARSTGMVSIIISLILSFAATSGEYARYSRLHLLYGLLGGAFLLWLLASSKIVDRLMSAVMKWALKKWTTLDTRDFVSLLNMSRGYTVRNLQVKEEDWLAGKTLKECQLTREGTTVLGIYRQGGEYLGAPKGETEIHPGDVLVLYGRGEALDDLDERRADFLGDQAHHREVSEQKKKESEEAAHEEEHQKKRQKQQQA